jgi:hypothetical protein
MKNSISTFLFLLVSFSVFGQIEWAPLGAKWYYTYSEMLFGAEYVVVVEVVGDTVIQGKNCRILKNEPNSLNWNWGCNNPIWNIEYMYGENGQVLFFNSFEDEFKLLHDFNAQKDDGWKIPLCDENFTVDSLEIVVSDIYYDTISNHTLRIIDVDESMNGFPSLIYEGIGSARQMFFQEQNIVTAEQGITNLRCYESPATGIIKFTEQPCGFISSTSEETAPQQYTIYPNPTSGPVTLTFKSLSDASSIQILNSYGQKIQEHLLPSTSEILQINNLQPGLYFVTLFANGQPIKTQKLLRL